MRPDPAVAAFLNAYGPLTVINLPARADRRAEFAGELARLGLSFDDPRVRLFPGLRPAAAGGFSSVGAHGCFLSHLAVLRAAVEAGREAALVCEDDLDFAPDLPARLAALAGPLAELDWSILIGGHRRPPRGAPAAPGLLRLPPEEEMVHAHLYMIRGPALAEFAAALGAMLARPAGHPDGGPMHFDGALNDFRRRNPHRAALAALPPLGMQRPSRSDIEAAWFDRWPGLRDGAQALRRLRRRAVAWRGRAP